MWNIGRPTRYTTKPLVQQETSLERLAGKGVGTRPMDSKQVPGSAGK